MMRNAFQFDAAHQTPDRILHGFGLHHAKLTDQLFGECRAIERLLREEVEIHREPMSKAQGQSCAAD